MVLPVVFYKLDGLDEMVNTMISEYENTFNEEPKIERVNSWKSSLQFLLKSKITHPVIAEYPIFSEYADFIFLNDNEGIVVEAKGWRRVKKIDEYTVEADGQLRQDPCIQLKNYVSKLNYFHPMKIKFRGILLLYNTSDYSTSEDCLIIRKPDELKREIDKLTLPSQDKIYNFINSILTITKDLISLLQGISDQQILSDFTNTLYTNGYGLTQEQLLLIEDILDSVKKNIDKTYLVKGGSGSGKTLVAITLFFEALRHGYNVVLGYKNNRLLNTLKYILEKHYKTRPLTGLIRFYSTGRVKPAGIGDDGYNETHDLAVFDEAQRMTTKVIENTQKRAKVKVYFFDEEQILLGEEEGTEANFMSIASKYSIVEKRGLTGSFRMPYTSLIEKLLNGEKVELPSSFFKVFTDIEVMLNELREKPGKKALVCAFTESEGDLKNKKSIKNVRIGYPLQSGFDLYKGKNLHITWLMDAKTEYPRYWSGQLDPLSYCASVYGAQGFEADYVGVVWGRDLVWREKWEINPSVITDNVGGNRFSLKQIAKKDKDRALTLLKNRYYIMLTRGIRGVYIFCEDEKTRDYLLSLIK
ncbi:hypothetical protein SJAV_08300 [Sulfurisphaera javensis]|uniref:Schlafen group 3-like DNA/RNA helicase domain-containing protein n=1 Tax=Sulfurisphaera javensis TaxID=2049879 RepID=A0AAT9GPP8_9CREN